MQSPLPTGSKGKPSASSGTLAFVKQLATYYMDFLETDFHRRRNPKRTIRFRNSDNLLVGVSLARYPSFLQQIPKLFQAAFDKNVVGHIAKGSYRTTIPTGLLKLIELELENVSETQFAGIRTALGGDIEQLARTNRSDYDKALTLSLEVAAKHVRAELIFPLVSHLQKPLENAGLGDENTRFLMEEELCELLIEPARNKISELVRKLVTGHPTDARSELEPVLTLSACRQRIVEFFSNFALGDLFSELYELDRNRTILEKQELYLYFGDIAHNGVKYPLFYIPFQASTARDDIGIEFDARLYVNKRALDFIVQEENDRTGKKGTLKSTAQRIIYLAQHEHTLADALSVVFFELSNFFGLDRTIDVRNPAAQLAKSASIRVTNAAYFGLFDSSDEALVNDYEQLLQLLAEAGPESAIAGAFSGLIDDFIHRNPESVTREVEEQWDSLSMPDRLVSESPIPLNSEQRQILLALKKDRCHYSTVEGPPGTGKSHTITAIVCDAVLSHRTVLVLSDKTEALDVVEDKITETLNRVRGDRQFQNPILRLGKTGSTYAQILSTAVMDGIKTHYRAVKKEHDSLEQTIQQRVSSVKEDLEAEALAYADVEMPEIREWAGLESYYATTGQLVDSEELLQSEDGVTDLEELRSVCVKVQQLLADPIANEIQSALGFKDLTDADQMSDLAAAARDLETVLTKLTQQYPHAERDLGMLRHLSADDIPDLTTFVSEFAALKQPIVGFLFTKRKAEALDLQFRKRFAFAASRPPHAHLAVLKRILDTVTVLIAQAQAASQPELRLSLCQRLLTQPLQRSVLRTLSELSEGMQTVTSAIQRYPRSAKSLRIRRSSCGSIATNRLTSLRDDDFSFLMRYLALTDQLVHKFQAIAETNYGEEIRRVQDLAAIHMTYIMDGQVIDFYENHRNTAKALRDVIRSKQQFPKEEFGKLREAFPCILAGIRDYAEFIPLEPELFDLLIIDEASQVSIAQALPALLRAKQILILGDKKQFSNIKAAQARSDTNREHLNRLELSFRENVSQEPSKLVKLERFNIRTSILEFFEFISNYHTQLLKHFRGYKELISYSNVNFYLRSLQAMKIRAKPIDEVIRFTQLQSTQAPAPRNVNSAEVEFIMGELTKLKAGARAASIGIITPHTDQQKLLVDTVGRSPDREYFYKDLNLKIMTFDTCQGEERDIIYYSMVANANNDRLWGVFIKNLASIDLEEDGQIKAQRLNVGFSRAKECVHFVISKPLEAFNGAVGEALRHFWAAREDARKERTAVDVDQKSVREAEVLNWFYQTEFWKAERERVEFIPQFEIGKYLKQLDPRYTHPLYRVDFLLTYRPNADREQKIVIEYDGFKEHFGAASGVDATNYETYYSEEDVFRQKVLESYGYRFLRVNRFNAGNDPIATLNTRIRLLLVSQPTMKGDTVLQSLHHTITQLKNGELKECPKCKEVRELKEFRDPKLASGVGRFCATCKGSKPSAASVRRGQASATAQQVTGPKPCPACGSRMILRNGRHGRFYGCAKYPFCRAIRPFSAR